jgi:hypothetical protein
MKYNKISCQKCNKEVGSNNFKRHEMTCEGTKECPVCGNFFLGKGVTCGYSCSNKLFRSGEQNGNWKQDAYQSTCWLYHGKKCLVCNEEKIVAVHHVNENHHDNRPENLVPLCPTHHQYVHSRFRDEVQPIIDRYLENFKLGVG